MSMNIFRLTGDVLHVVSITILLFLVAKRRNAAGISCRSQELFLLVFCLRYLDLFTTFYSLYNCIMKVFYIATTASIVFFMRYKEPTSSTYNRTLDLSTISNKTLIIPCVAVGTTVHYFGSLPYGFDFIELLWSISIALEVVAMLPQLVMFRRNRNIPKMVKIAIACMGAYRFLYIVNWWYRANYEPHYKHHWMVYIAGGLQTLFYLDFVSYHGGCEIPEGILWGDLPLEDDEASLGNTATWGTADPLLRGDSRKKSADHEQFKATKAEPLSENAGVTDIDAGTGAGADIQIV